MELSHLQHVYFGPRGKICTTVVSLFTPTQLQFDRSVTEQEKSESVSLNNILINIWLSRSGGVKVLLVGQIYSKSCFPVV